jgi:hypothetical protein
MNIAYFKNDFGVQIGIFEKIKQIKHSALCFIIKIRQIVNFALSALFQHKARQMYYI